MKNLSIGLFFLLIAIMAKSQNINLEFRTGYGFYNLSEIKSFQSSLVNSSHLPSVKAVETFPNNIFYSFSANYILNRANQIGLEFSYLTTGGRNHVADYSGEYKLDMHLNGYRIGPRYEYLIFNNGRFAIGLQAAVGLLFSRLNMNENLVINNQEILSEKVDLKSTGLYVEPSVRITYNIYKQINFNFQGGYEFDFKDKMYMEGEETNVDANWSGIRLSVGISYSFGKKDNTSFE